jgi:hypothetical protein
VARLTRFLSRTPCFPDTPSPSPDLTAAEAGTQAPHIPTTSQPSSTGAEPFSFLKALIVFSFSRASSLIRCILLFDLTSTVQRVFYFCCFMISLLSQTPLRNMVERGFQYRRRILLSGRIILEWHRQVHCWSPTKERKKTRIKGLWTCR